jgi:hypothetical protein
MQLPPRLINILSRTFVRVKKTADLGGLDAIACCNSVDNLQWGIHEARASNVPTLGR